MKGWFAGILLFICSNFIEGQNAPVTILGSVTGQPFTTVYFPVTVQNFSNIGAVSLTLEYDYSVLHFLQGVPHPQMTTFALGDADLGNGMHRISMGWYGFGLTLPDGSAILTLSFSYLGGSSDLSWIDTGSTCEYADAMSNILNDIPFSSYYFNGRICGTMGMPSGITGPTTVCQAQTGAVYSVAPVSNATSYQWTVPSGASIVTGNGTTSVTVDFSPSAQSGPVSVHGVNPCGNGPLTQIPVVVNAMPVANAGNDTTIPYGTIAYLHAAPPGPGTFQFHWEPAGLLVNPNVQNPQTVNLTATTLFTVTETNSATNCTASDEVVVNVSGGPLTVTPTVTDDTVCQGSTVQLFANAGGGSGNYSYTWTCTPATTPPWISSQPNPVVIPESNCIYHVVVNDLFNTVSANVPVVVHAVPTATISGGDTVCGSGNSAEIIIELTGTPPWNFVYSIGGTAIPVLGQLSSPYLFTVTQPGTYTLVSVTDAHCPGTVAGNAIFLQYPVPAPPLISVDNEMLVSNLPEGNQWFLNGDTIPGATEAYYFPQVTGHYHANVTLNGCSSVPSNEIYFIMTGFERTDTFSFSIAPVPANDVLFLTLPEFEIGEYLIHLISLSGIRVREWEKKAVAGALRGELDVSGLSPGIYFLKVIREKTVSIRKIILE